MDKEFKCLLYEENDINSIIKLLSRTKADFENFELFYMIKKVLLNPIPFKCIELTTQIKDENKETENV